MSNVNRRVENTEVYFWVYDRLAEVTAFDDTFDPSDIDAAARVAGKAIHGEGAMSPAELSRRRAIGEIARLRVIAVVDQIREIGSA